MTVLCGFKAFFTEVSCGFKRRFMRFPGGLRVLQRLAGEFSEGSKVSSRLKAFPCVSERFSRCQRGFRGIQVNFTEISWGFQRRFKALVDQVG